MKPMKRAACLLLAALMMSSAWGCAAGPAPDPDEPDVEVGLVLRAMMDADTTLPEMVTRSSGDGDAEDSFFYLSDLDYGRVEEYAYAFADAGTAEEMAVVKLKDRSDAAAMMDSLHRHVDARQGTFEEYDPEQVPLTQNAVVIREGRYVALIVSGKNGLAQKEFQKFFQAE